VTFGSSIRHVVTCGEPEQATRSFALDGRGLATATTIANPTTLATLRAYMKRAPPRECRTAFAGAVRGMSAMTFLRRLWRIPKLTRSLHEAYNQHKSAEILRQFYFRPKTSFLRSQDRQRPSTLPREH